MGVLFTQRFSKKHFPGVTPLLTQFISECCERQSSSYCTLNELAYAFMIYLLHAMHLRLDISMWINDPVWIWMLYCSPRWWEDRRHQACSFDPRKWHAFSAQAIRAHLAELGLCEVPTANGDSMIVGLTLLRILDGVRGTFEKKLILKYREGEENEEFIELRMPSTVLTSSSAT